MHAALKQIHILNYLKYFSRFLKFFIEIKNILITQFFNYRFHIYLLEIILT